MAKRYKVDAMATFDDIEYNVPFEFLGNTRQFPEYPYSHSESLIGTYVSYMAERISLALGFNPFNICKLYTTGSIGFNNVDSGILSVINQLGVNYEVFESNESGNRFSSWKLNNGESFNISGMGIPNDYSQNQVLMECPCLSLTFGKTGSGLDVSYYVNFYINLFPDIAYHDGLFDMDMLTNKFYRISGRAYFDDQLTYIASRSFSFTVENNYRESFVTRNLAIINTNMDFIIDGDDMSYSDSGNPYGVETSATGGYSGSDPYMNVDAIEKVEFPDLPTLSAASAGLCTIYNPSLSQMQALSNYLWESPTFDINNFKRLFASPMDAIIGLGIIPVAPTLSGSSNVMFGNIDSGVAMPKLASQFVEKDMGSVRIKKWVDCFLDYDCTDIQIYVPFCGLYSLNPVEVMGKTLTLKYHIDCLTGGCAAMLAVDGCIMYQWNGSCIANVPLTAMNYATAIQNAVSAVGNVASMASGGNPVSNLASVTNAFMNIKPQVQKGGNMGGSAGLMSVQQPYVIITRPNMSVPNKLNKFAGNTLNVTMKLGKVKGFTQVELIRLDGIPCTDNEKEELLSLLKEGVIF